MGLVHLRNKNKKKLGASNTRWAHPNNDNTDRLMCYVHPNDYGHTSFEESSFFLIGLSYTDILMTKALKYLSSLD